MGAIFDLPEKAERAGQLEQAAQHPDFWKEPDRAQRVLKELGDLKEQLTLHAAFRAEIEDQRTLLELAREAEDEETLREVDRTTIFPASHYVTPQERLIKAIEGIGEELEVRLAELEKQKKLLEMQRLEQRTHILAGQAAIAVAVERRHQHHCLDHHAVEAAVGRGAASVVAAGGVSSVRGGTCERSSVMCSRPCASVQR